MTTRSAKLEYRLTETLRPYDRNARKHPKKQIRQIADSIERFGFNAPVLVTGEGEIIAGHGRVAAAKLLKLKKVPTIRVDHLSDAERRAYILADNKLGLNATWDTEMLALELEELGSLDIDLSLTGFSMAEIDIVLDDAKEANPVAKDTPEDEIPTLGSAPISRLGDVWQLGRHRLICADARDSTAYTRLLADERGDMIFCDPPYNCKIGGHVSGLGSTRHREFVMASGEMADDEFEAFLGDSLRAGAGACRDGAIAFVCMDFRGMESLIGAARPIFGRAKQLCVWAKSNGGMGSFYRSRHELVFVFKKGSGRHTNNFGLGETGRYRTNVWEYPGISSMSSTRTEELAMHPTVKPVALVADAIRDCSNRGDVVLDMFGGSGTTLIAAEKTGRTARLVELDPLYCDTIIRRFEKYTGKEAILVGNGQTFEDVATARDLEITARDLETGEAA